MTQGILTHKSWLHHVVSNAKWNAYAALQDESRARLEIGQGGGAGQLLRKRAEDASAWWCLNNWQWPKSSMVDRRNPGPAEIILDVWIQRGSARVSHVSPDFWNEPSLQGRLTISGRPESIERGQGACAARGSSKVVTLADIIESDPTRKQTTRYNLQDTTGRANVFLAYSRAAGTLSIHRRRNFYLLSECSVSWTVFAQAKHKTSLISMLILPSMLLRFVSVLYCLPTGVLSHTMWRQDQANNI